LKQRIGGAAAQNPARKPNEVSNEDHWPITNLDKPFFQEFKERVEAEHFSQLKQAQQNIREKEHTIVSLKEHIKTQAEAMAKVQAEMDQMFIDSRYKKEQESKYIKRELDKLAKQDMNKQV
jgi:molecular chaperone GrpE (heat shock protein)